MRLLGCYDNVWLSHADREHILPSDVRPRWAGANGGVGNTVFVDGFMAGLWWWRDGRVVTELFRRPTRAQAAELEEESAAVEVLLGVG